MCKINSLNKSYDQIYDILLKESKKINENRELQDIKILQNFRNKKRILIQKFIFRHNWDS